MLNSTKSIQKLSDRNYEVKKFEDDEITLTPHTNTQKSLNHQLIDSETSTISSSSSSSFSCSSTYISENSSLRENSKLKNNISKPITIPSHIRFGSFIHKNEIPRKVFHSSIGFLTLWLYAVGIQFSQVTPILMAILVIVLSSDLIRFRWPAFNEIYISVLGPLMRQKEINSYNGVIFYLIGLIFVFSFFPKDVSLISLLLLSWADTAASTFGRAYGHLTPKIGNGKSLAGSLAAFATGVISAVLLYKYFIPKYNYNNLPGDIFWTPETSFIPFSLLVLICGLIGAISEAIDIYEIDDNLTIPALSAIILYFILYFSQKK
ncbi:uncharacterized protein SAPINGB_P005642 [Magnusiomyces paraingens]|uniref:Phosphatidate cytidylyltransferase n=1 Tax=Magnusiomyces paraingens TaxID=2606893 RepID=A0A5E8C7S7_9ASCO|nr:uncharacterized protein SAPINGB_P005642 [Saprochaete ingens]VVT57286.1 unnamed protein product [Saprochaete ingens]